MGDSSITVTPNISRYELRSRTPTTPKNGTPTARSLRSNSNNTPTAINNVTPSGRNTPLKSINPLFTPSSSKPATPRRQLDTNTPSKSSTTRNVDNTVTSKLNTPASNKNNIDNIVSSTKLETPINNDNKINNIDHATNLDQVFTPTPTPRLPGTPGTPVSNRLLRSNSTPKTEEKLVFKTPMQHKPRMIDNKPVPSPSRSEIWKQELGLSDEPDHNSDKENTSSDDEDKGQTSLVEFRALQKVLAEKSTQRDESLLQIKNYKDKIRLFKTKLEREETTKRQQLKILKKSHETQMHEKEQLIDNLQSIINEQEDRLKELEENIASTPRKRKQLAISPTESASKLIEDIKRLQGEKSSLATQLNDVQLELNTLREEVNPLKAPATPRDKWTNQEESSQNNNCNHSILPASCTTDTEKQVEVLQAENLRLLHDLTETKNAHTKALTVSKLNNHRHQQLEEEITRLKMKVSSVENDLENQRQLRSAGNEKLSSLELENLHLQEQIKQAQAENCSLRAKSPEVVRETRVKQVESEALKKRYEEKKQEIEQLKQALSGHKGELHEAHTQNNILEKMLKLAQTEKEEGDSHMWKELENLKCEHKKMEKCLRDKLEKDKQDTLQMLEKQLVCTHKKHLEDLQESLQTKHQSELTRLDQTNNERINTLTEDCAQRISKIKHDKESEISKITAAKSKDISDLVSKIEELRRKHDKEMKHLEEDMTIAKNAAVTRIKEELHRDKEVCLKALEDRLEAEHQEEIVMLQEQKAIDLEEAVRTEREKNIERMNYLETKYESLVAQLALLNPVLSEFVDSYVQLQREVQNFPKVIQKTVANVKKEMVEAITGISEYNKQLVTKYQKELKLRKKYHNELVELKGNIRVFCRVRPLIKEDGQGLQAENIVSPDQDDDGLVHINCKARPQSFDVDRVFDETCTQEMVYDEVKALVTSCIDGYNVCIFAYGQTGSGKTYTMEGTRDNPGINQRALIQLFEDTKDKGGDWDFTITVSVLEIYNEMIRDLLNDDPSYKMEVKINPDGGFHIPGLSYVTVESVDTVNECFTIGKSNRATAATNMNEHSSRSHALLCVTVVGINKLTGTKTTGKLNLVDLAGSERVSKSKSDGTRLKEAQSINKSLSSLGDVIFALRSKQNFVPYRNSKLTYLLQDSLGGDSKTLMITQISPVRKNEGETICSLNFAQRVRNVELGAATRKLENGDVTESLPCSPARTVGTPQRGIASMKPSTPSSASKLTPNRQFKKK